MFLQAPFKKILIVLQYIQFVRQTVFGSDERFPQEQHEITSDFVHMSG